jgi:hypothetical protein
MLRALKSIPTYLLLIPLLHFWQASAQERADYTDETDAKIPALVDFHKTIYTMWHDAWPAKDISMLARLSPDLQRQSDSLSAIRLPGILRDRQNAWDVSLKNLQRAVAEYAAATASRDSAGLLDAAERLHALYETLARTTRPRLKEAEEFHKVLYVIYHHYLPEGRQADLSNAVGELKARMADLERATLPARLLAREEAFAKARKNLAASVASLRGEGVDADPATVRQEIEAVHTAYQALERALE